MIKIEAKKKRLFLIRNDAFDISKKCLVNISVLLKAKKEEWWSETESNRRHGDFQSPALPTELSDL